jgi:sugar lactone lactonase YvrE
MRWQDDHDRHNATELTRWRVLRFTWHDVTTRPSYVAFTIADDGSLAERRVWAEVPSIAPDGCALDAEGHIWSADARGGRACRLAPGGAIVEEIVAPQGLQFFACMLGGDDGRTLLVCAAPDFSECRRSQARDAVLLTTRVDVPHAGLP